MPTDIFESSVLKLVGNIVQGHSGATTGSFDVQRGAVSVQSITAPISGGRATADFTAPKVNNDEDNYPLAYKFKVEGDAYDGADKFKVWPRTVAIKVLRKVDGKPFDGFQLHVAQDGSDDVATMDANGECVFHLKKPAPFTITATPPNEIVEWTPGKDAHRIRECKAVRHFKAVFVAPVVPADGKPIEQLVNHSTASGKLGQDTLSNTVTFEVAAEGDAARAPADRIGHEGDPIFIEVNFSRENKRNSPLPALLDATGIVTTADGQKATGKVLLGAHGASAKFRVELGLAGGDTATVKIGSTPAAADAKHQFINWRKLYYQLTYPGTMTKPSMARITATLAAVNIRYESYKEVAFADGDTGTPAGSWFDGPMIGLTGRCVNIGDHNKAWFHQKFVDTKTPRGAHVLFCHKQFDGGVPAHASTVSTNVVKATGAPAFPATFAAPPPPATPSPPPAMSPPPPPTTYGYIHTMPDGQHVFTKSLQDGADSVRGGTWTVVGGAAPFAGRTGPLTPADVYVDWNAFKNQVAIRLPAEAQQAVDAGNTVRLVFTVCYCNGEYLGESDGTHKNWQLIVSMVDSSANDVMSHELGHTMSQVQASVPPGLAAADHGWKYTGRGHQGPHCAFGAPAATFSGTGPLTGIASCKCIMYGENSSTGSNSDGNYCEKCSPFVKAQELASIT